MKNIDPRHYDVIVAPVVTEKATVASEHNKVLFKVSGKATKPQITAYKKAREWMDRGLDGIKAGVGTDEVAALLPKAEEFGFGSEMEAFGLQFAHGLGLGLHERPIISRLNSMREPIELQAGMVFALETYCPADDGFSAARIEEEVVVTADGPRILTLFPAQDLVVANPF